MELTNCINCGVAFVVETVNVDSKSAACVRHAEHVDSKSAAYVRHAEHVDSKSAAYVRHAEHVDSKSAAYVRHAEHVDSKSAAYVRHAEHVELEHAADGPAQVVPLAPVVAEPVLRVLPGARERRARVRDAALTRRRPRRPAQQSAGDPLTIGSH